MFGQVRILVIDDEESMRDSCRQALARGASRVEVAGDGRTGLGILEKEAFDLVILDLKMPGLSGMDVLNIIKEKYPEIVVVVITGYATVESAVEAMKCGAYDFLPKPFTPDGLRQIVGRALERKELTLENILLRSELKASFGSEAIVGQSEPMKEIEQVVRKVSPTDTTVLISGESGTGKELIARAIHYHSDRRDKPFVVVDCGSLVESLFESELFGHVKGSFTGAEATKYGRLELANGGTVFFDEIGNISLSVQTKLLRVLQEREITKVGSSQVIKVDVRVIAATNRDLQKATQEETFREDLFYRLSVVPITLPPLRERQDDIPPLANYFLKKYNQKRKKNIRAISRQAMKTLVDYNWPGNVRELENAIERAVVLTENDTIEPSDLLYYGLNAAMPAQSDADTPRSLVDVEKEHIARILKMFNGHKGKTAEWLGIDRKTLRTKLKRYALE
ncbi:MAG: sigma-54-dependent Fis family transcriptional regulator [Sedimentisphaerales bacterium]|nr:sigma-54-dependent Fis family transcriptional regulator [Sedimentisphaerales bacterium]